MIKEKDSIMFEDRNDAGRQLGEFLKKQYRSCNPLILGVPRGGVVVAQHVAMALKAELGIIIAKKLPLPRHAEIGFGAIAEDMSVYVSPRCKQTLAPEVICEIIDQQTDEVNRRIEQYRRGEALPDMAGRTVIVVDDGIATGATLVPVIRLCRKMRAAKVIIAAPVAGKNFDANLHEADALEILTVPEWFYAVGQVYAFFKDLSDEETIAALQNTNAYVIKHNSIPNQ